MGSFDKKPKGLFDDDDEELDALLDAVANGEDPVIEKTPEPDNGFTPLVLNEQNVTMLYKRCLSPGGSLLKEKVKENEDSIFYLLGQLETIHKDVREHPMNINLCRDYYGKNWTDNTTIMVNLLNLGLLTGSCELRNNRKDYFFSITIHPTFSPDDPNFSKWWGYGAAYMKKAAECLQRGKRAMVLCCYACCEVTNQYRWDKTFSAQVLAAKDNLLQRKKVGRFSLGYIMPRPDGSILPEELFDAAALIAQGDFMPEEKAFNYVKQFVSAAAQMDYAPAQYAMAIGSCGEISPLQAYKYCEKAAAQGHEEAIALLPKLKKKAQQAERELNEENVQAVFNRCGKLNADGSTDWDKEKLAQEYAIITHLLGQLALVHQEVRSAELNEKFYERYDGVKWTSSMNMVIRLLNMGGSSDLLHFSKTDEKHWATLSTSIKPAPSPKDPKFEEWWEKNVEAERAYEEGKKARKEGDLAKARSCFETALEKGKGYAAKSALEEIDKFEKVLEKANMGDAEAQFQLAAFYDFQVIELLKKASAQGHKGAAIVLKLLQDDVLSSDERKYLTNEFSNFSNSVKSAFCAYQAERLRKLADKM